MSQKRPSGRGQSSPRLGFWARCCCSVSGLVGGGLPLQSCLAASDPRCRGDSTVGQLPPYPLRREETPGGGGFLWPRHAPWPLPLDTLVFFVTCFSFCFSSLLPFFRGHFHFRLAVSPHPTPTHPFYSAARRPPSPPATSGSPVAPSLPGPLFPQGEHRGGSQVPWAPQALCLASLGPRAPLLCDESKNINLRRCEEKRR